MCGIVGIVNFTTPLNHPEAEIAVMNRTLSHRGPDSSDFHISFGAQVAVGHTLLSIVGTGTNSQPLRRQIFVEETQTQEVDR